MASEKIEDARWRALRSCRQRTWLNAGWPSLSEVEIALTMTSNAFQRWIVHCMAASGQPGLRPVEILILHSVRHRDLEETLSNLSPVLGRLTALLRSFSGQYDQAARTATVT